MQLNVVQENLKTLIDGFNNCEAISINVYFKYFKRLVLIKASLQMLKTQEKSEVSLYTINKLLKKIKEFENILFKNTIYKNTKIINNKILALFKNPNSILNDLSNLLEEYRGRCHLGILGESLIHAVMEKLEKYKKIFIADESIYKPLVKHSLYDILKWLFKYDLKILGLTFYQQKIMEKAISNCDLKLIKLLIKEGISPNLKIGVNNLTIISWAMQFKNMSIINLLINCGAIINVVNDNRTTPLQQAVLTGDVKFLKEVLKIKGLIISMKDKNNKNDFSPITIISNFSDSKLKIDIIKAFLTMKKLDVINEDDEVTEYPIKEIKDDFKKLLFLEIKKRNSIEVISFLLNLKINVTEIYEDTTFLIHAIKSFNLKVKLIKNKTSDKTTQKKLIKIEKEFLLEIIMLLLDAGADINLKNKANNLPILEAIKSNDAEILEMLINKGTNLNYVDENNNNLLHKAIMLNKQKAALFLLKAGVSSKALNQDGKSGHFLAIEAKMVELTKKMIEKGLHKRYNF